MSLCLWPTTVWNSKNYSHPHSKTVSTYTSALCSSRLKATSCHVLTLLLAVIERGAEGREREAETERGSNGERKRGRGPCLTAGPGRLLTALWSHPRLEAWELIEGLSSIIK